jgi:hypothetical protein
MKRIAAIIVSLLFSGAAHGASYGVMQWGIDKSVSPYGFGYNVNGSWSNLGTVSSAGVWSIPIKNTSLKIINVLDYGALGNGTTDDSAAFYAAVVTAASMGVLVFTSLQLHLIIN